MGTVDYVSLEVSSLTKQFVQDDNLRWKRDSDAHKSMVALDCGSFQVCYGEILGIMGADDLGLSAVVHSIADRLVADGGRVTVSGRNVLRDEVAVKRLINRVLADAVLFNKLTPMQILIYGARLYGLGEQAARGCAWEVLKQIGLDEHEIFSPLEETSIFVQQQVVAACASLTQPAFLLLNEPTTGLPAMNKQKVQSLMKELRDVYNATILLTTRDVREANALCDRIAILDEGQIVALDTPAGLKSRVSRTNGHVPTLKDVFVELTGKQLVQ
ncbi:MAG: ATP-binding cassette domain-containing protein [Chloroflexi bacterium]|nr:ATP-binding cassette domain-containing protein [Chloroflexota bacterium]